VVGTLGSFLPCRILPGNHLLFASPSVINLCTFYHLVAGDGRVKLSQLGCELKDDTITASAHSFLGWALACEGDARKVRSEFLPLTTVDMDQLETPSDISTWQENV